MKNILFKSIFCLGLLALVSCDFSDKDPKSRRLGRAPEVVESQFDGMLLVKATDEAVTLGDESPNVSSDARPLMDVTFTYDFHLDRYEVTNKSFQKLMNYQPNPEAKGQYPVNQVNWFEAISYCNARSRELGLDTVYEYQDVELNSQGHIQSLDGVKINLDVEGFRLPLEAEWEYVTRFNQSDDLESMAWYVENSGSVIHKVGDKIPGVLGFYDLQGNVMEWINDWKGSYQDLDVDNFAGAIGPNTLEERIVKGGSYQHGLNFLHPSNRGDIYPINTEIAGDYIGFRCALGPIDNPSYLSETGIQGENAMVEITASLTQVQGHLGKKAKLAFINRGSGEIQVVDFSQSPLQIRNYTPEGPAFHPVISPDGRYLAYSSKIEGANGESETRVINLYTEEPYKLDVSSAGIPRWREVDGKIYLIYGDNTSSNQDFNEWTNKGKTWSVEFDATGFGTPEVILAEGAYTGGVDSSGRYFASGYTQLRTYDINAEKSTRHFQYPDHGKIEEASDQVCNVSLSPGKEAEMLFLDFGYNEKSEVTGDSYGIHALIFRSGIEGEITRWYHVPGDEKGWDHTEWSNHPDFAVSTATNQAEEHHAIYLIDLKDSLYLKLIEGSKVWHPNLWVGEELVYDGDLNLDSIGRYGDPEAIIATKEFSFRMHYFWQLHDSIEVLGLGSSRLMNGLAPLQINDLKAFNLGVSAGNIDYIADFYHNYAVPHIPNLQYLVVSLDFAWWWRSTEHFDNSIGRTKGYQYDKSNNFWKDGLPSEYRKVYAAADYTEIYAADFDTLGGHYGLVCGGWGGSGPQIDRDTVGFIVKENWDANIARLEGVLNDAKNREIEVIGVIYPQSPFYRQTGSQGRYGPSRSYSVGILEYLNSLTSKYSNFHLMDENQSGNHDYTDAEAQNWDHLCDPGISQLTQRVDQKIQELRNP